MKTLKETVKALNNIIVEQGMPKKMHRVGVTLSDPNHTAVSKRKVKMQRFARVRATNQQEATQKARQHYTTRGYKVHDVNYIGEVE
jgi:hypothetical protein